MKKLLLVLPLLAMIMSGCKKEFFDINQNPNTAGESSITPDLILPGALSRTGSFTSTSFATVGAWMGYWAVPTNYGAVGEHRYIMTTAFGDGAWTTSYDILFDYHTMEQRAQASGQTFYQGIGKIMKALHYQILVDLFNNVPYTNALDIKGNISPKYDKGEDIYKDLLKQISDGVKLIKEADASKNTNIDKTDIMFHGDKTLWAKFGNTLRLRLLVHMSEIPGFSGAAEIANNTSDGYLMAGENADVNPGYTTDKPNPFWALYGFTVDGTAFPNDFRRANNFALNIMKGLADERHKHFYRAVRSGTFAGQYRGIDYGINNDPTSQYNQGNTSDIGGAPTAAGGPSGLAKSATMDAWILNAFESYFLQAEARARGWITSGPTAKELYEEGVRESFRWLGVPSAVTTANTYLTSTDTRVAFGADVTANIKAIIWQKYFAFNGNNHLEAWTDYRRTGIVSPAISIDPGRLTNTVPTRYPYPSTEFNYNLANVNAEGTINPYTSKIFWDR